MTHARVDEEADSRSRSTSHHGLVLADIIDDPEPSNGNHQVDGTKNNEDTYELPSPVVEKMVVP
jgi:hypothetical protein